jgi:hypothetical protein
VRSRVPSDFSDSNFKQPAFVIPGRCEASKPESISHSIVVVPWIPGLRLSAHPGMTTALEALVFSHAFAFPQA